MKWCNAISNWFTWTNTEGGKKQKDRLDVFDAVGTDSLSNKLDSASERWGLVVKEGLFQINLLKHMEKHGWHTLKSSTDGRHFVCSVPEVSAVNGWWRVPSVLQTWEWSCESSLRSWTCYQPRKQQEVYETLLPKQWRKDTSIALNWKLFQPKLSKRHFFQTVRPHLDMDSKSREAVGPLMGWCPEKKIIHIVNSGKIRDK